MYFLKSEVFSVIMEANPWDIGLSESHLIKDRTHNTRRKLDHSHLYVSVCASGYPKSTWFIDHVWWCLLPYFHLWFLQHQPPLHVELQVTGPQGLHQSDTSGFGLFPSHSFLLCASSDLNKTFIVNSAVNQTQGFTQAMQALDQLSYTPSLLLTINLLKVAHGGKFPPLPFFIQIAVQPWWSGSFLLQGQALPW